MDPHSRPVTTPQGEVPHGKLGSLAPLSFLSASVVVARNVVAVWTYGELARLQADTDDELQVLVPQLRDHFSPIPLDMLGKVEAEVRAYSVHGEADGDWPCMRESPTA